MGVRQKREPWLDNAKMVAMLCVIAGHSSGLFVNGLPELILGIIIAFNMPLFVLLSGYTSLGRLLKIGTFKNLVDYAEKTLWRMVIPAVCLSAFDQAWRGLIFARKLWILYGILAIILWLVEKCKDQGYTYLPDRGVVALRVLLVGFLLYSSLNLNMYWFLSMLMKLQIFAAVLIFVGKCTNASAVYLVAVVSFILWGFSFMVFDDWTFEMSVYFALGLAMKQTGLFDRLLRINQWVSIAMCIIGCALCRLFTIDFGFYANSLSELVANGLYHVYPLRVAVALLISFAIIRWMYALSRDYNWISKMGSYTLAFYTIHVLILDGFIKPYVHFDNPSNYMWVFGVLATVALTIITYIIILACEKWRVTQRLVLGIIK